KVPAPHGGLEVRGEPRMLPGDRVDRPPDPLRDGDPGRFNDMDRRATPPPRRRGAAGCRAEVDHMDGFAGTAEEHGQVAQPRAVAEPDRPATEVDGPGMTIPAKDVLLRSRHAPCSVAPAARG